uniref:Putative lipocalin n=1 Tax=Ixodes ricinus TaxID=34613 RepID=A0A6B0UYY7_IXORI
MIALFLGILFLYHIQASSSKKNKGDYPDANEVMKNLPQTFMLQSLGNYTGLICGYQHFYNETLRGQTYRKYDLLFKYPTTFFSQPLYVKDVTKNKIYMGSRPETYFPPDRELDILFSDMQSCMVSRKPAKQNSKACNLMVTKTSFDKPPELCLQKFKEYCQGQAFNYTITGCPYPEKLK